jgi:hydroxymethylbilane synthase
LFTKEIEEALLEGRIDIAVHSLKDMPTAIPQGLQIAATPLREDARDVMIGAMLSEVRSGGRIGTGSLRRIAQLGALRPDVIAEPVRGNVDTRLRKLDEGQFDAIVLAAAGLRRLGWADRIAEYLSPEVMCPAVGQGSLAIQTRSDGGAALLACSALNHPETFSAVSAERAVLSVLGGGCQVPVGAYATVHDGTIALQAVVCSADGRRIVRREASGEAKNSDAIGERLGEELLAGGAREILQHVYAG